MCCRTSSAVQIRIFSAAHRETYIEGLQAQLKKGGEQRRDDDGHEDAQHSDGPNVIQVVGFDLPEDNYETC